MLGLAAIALAALVAFFIRQRRAANPLYDLDVAGRRIFWVAACAGIIVFGSLMAAMFVSQQYLQNVLGYSTLEAGAAILPAALVMVVVAPRSAKLVEARGARFTLLCRLRVPAPRVPVDARWSGTRAPRTGRSPPPTSSSAQASGSPGTPASHSLTGSVPVTRAGMASGHGRSPARPRRRDHAVDLRRAAHRGLRLVGRVADRCFGPAGHGLDAGPAHEVVRGRRGRRSAAPAVRRRDHRRGARRRSSRATTGPTRPASSRFCSARCSSSSCSRGMRRRSSCSPSYHEEDTGPHSVRSTPVRPSPEPSGGTAR